MIRLLTLVALISLPTLAQSHYAIAPAVAVVDGVIAELIVRNPIPYAADATVAASAKGDFAKI